MNSIQGFRRGPRQVVSGPSKRCPSDNSGKKHNEPQQQIRGFYSPRIATSQIDSLLSCDIDFDPPALIRDDPQFREFVKPERSCSVSPEPASVASKHVPPVARDLSTMFLRPSLAPSLTSQSSCSPARPDDLASAEVVDRAPNATFEDDDIGWAAQRLSQAAAELRKTLRASNGPQPIRPKSTNHAVAHPSVHRVLDLSLSTTLAPTRAAPRDPRGAAQRAAPTAPPPEAHCAACSRPADASVDSDGAAAAAARAADAVTGVLRAATAAAEAAARVGHMAGLGVWPAPVHPGSCRSRHEPCPEAATAAALGDGDPHPAGGAAGSATSIVVVKHRARGRPLGGLDISDTSGSDVELPTRRARQQRGARGARAARARRMQVPRALSAAAAGGTVGAGHVRERDTDVVAPAPSDALAATPSLVASPEVAAPPPRAVRVDAVADSTLTDALTAATAAVGALARCPVALYAMPEVQAALAAVAICGLMAQAAGGARAPLTPTTDQWCALRAAAVYSRAVAFAAARDAEDEAGAGDDGPGATGAAAVRRPSAARGALCCATRDLAIDSRLSGSMSDSEIVPTRGALCGACAEAGGYAAAFGRHRTLYATAHARAAGALMALVAARAPPGDSVHAAGHGPCDGGVSGAAATRARGERSGRGAELGDVPARGAASPALTATAETAEAAIAAGLAGELMAATGGARVVCTCGVCPSTATHRTTLTESEGHPGHGVRAVAAAASVAAALAVEATVHRTLLHGAAERAAVAAAWERGARGRAADAAAAAAAATTPHASDDGDVVQPSHDADTRCSSPSAAASPTTAATDPLTVVPAPPLPDGVTCDDIPAAATGGAAVRVEHVLPSRLLRRAGVWLLKGVVCDDVPPVGIAAAGAPAGGGAGCVVCARPVPRWVGASAANAALSAALLGGGGSGGGVPPADTSRRRSRRRAAAGAADPPPPAVCVECSVGATVAVLSSPATPPPRAAAQLICATVTDVAPACSPALSLCGPMLVAPRAMLAAAHPLLTPQLAATHAPGPERATAVPAAAAAASVLATLSALRAALDVAASVGLGAAPCDAGAGSVPRPAHPPPSHSSDGAVHGDVCDVRDMSAWGLRPQCARARAAHDGAACGAAPVFHGYVALAKEGTDAALRTNTLRDYNTPWCDCVAAPGDAADHLQRALSSAPSSGTQRDNDVSCLQVLPTRLPPTPTASPQEGTDAPPSQPRDGASVSAPCPRRCSSAHPAAAWAPAGAAGSPRTGRRPADAAAGLVPWLGGLAAALSGCLGGPTYAGGNWGTCGRDCCPPQSTADAPASCRASRSARVRALVRSGSLASRSPLSELSMASLHTAPSPPPPRTSPPALPDGHPRTLAGAVPVPLHCSAPRTPPPAGLPRPRSPTAKRRRPAHTPGSDPDGARGSPLRLSPLGSSVLSSLPSSTATCPQLHDEIQQQSHQRALAPSRSSAMGSIAVVLTARALSLCVNIVAAAAPLVRPPADPPGVAPTPGAAGKAASIGDDAATSTPPLARPHMASPWAAPAARLAAPSVAVAAASAAVTVAVGALAWPTAPAVGRTVGCPTSPLPHVALPPLAAACAPYAYYGASPPAVWGRRFHSDPKRAVKALAGHRGAAADGAREGSRVLRGAHAEASGAGGSTWCTTGCATARSSACGPILPHPTLRDCVTLGAVAAMAGAMATLEAMADIPHPLSAAGAGGLPQTCPASGDVGSVPPMVASDGAHAASTAALNAVANAAERLGALAGLVDSPMRPLPPHGAASGHVGSLLTAADPRCPELTVAQRVYRFWERACRLEGSLTQGGKGDTTTALREYRAVSLAALAAVPVAQLIVGAPSRVLTFVRGGGMPSHRDSEVVDYGAARRIVVKVISHLHRYVLIESAAMMLTADVLRTVHGIGDALQTEWNIKPDETADSNVL